MSDCTPRKWLLEKLNALDADALVQALGGIYEHSPWVAEAVAPQRPFSSVEALHAAMEEAVRHAPRERRMELIHAHPDLAGRLAKQGGLTAASAQEQHQAGLDSLTPDRQQEMESLNTAYRRRFGFPFIICARLNDAGTIIEAMRRRLRNEPEVEFAEALQQIGLIAKLRLGDLVEE